MSVITLGKSKLYNFSDADNIYQNIDIYNNTNQTIDATFEATRTAPILDNPSDYELAIVRFLVPTKNIPIMILDPPSKNYKVSCDYNGYIVTTNVVWIPNNNCPETNYWVSTYQEFIDAINLALQTTFTQVKTAFPAYPGTQAPYFRLDGELVNFVAEQSIAVPSVRWYLNSDLQAIIPTISYNLNCFGGNLSYQIVIKDNRNNSEIVGGVPVFVMISESSCLFLWNDFQNLLFQSNSIPIVPELLGTSVQNTRRVLTDFNPPSQIFDRTPLQFFPQGPLRFYDLKSNSPLSAIDLTVSWIDKSGRIRPMRLAPKDNLSVKILFRKKSTVYKNYTNDY